jgi:Na+-driven multidrug efflux pump
MLFVLASSKFISINIFHSDGLLKLMPIVVVAIPAWVIRDVIGGILRGYKDALRALIPESFISPFFRIVVFLILILKGVSPLYAIIAFVAGEVLAVIASIIFLQNKVKGLKPVKKSGYLVC